MHLRKIVSLTALMTFAALAVSGTVLFAVPQGRVANWAGWSLAGLAKDEWGGIHIAVAFLFVVAGVWHTVLNWKPIVGYLRDHRQNLRVVTPHMLVALAMTTAMIILAQLDLPPVSWLLSLNASLKDSAAKRWGEPPYGHAELSTLMVFAGQVGLDQEKALELLRRAKMVVEGEGQTLAAIASANRVTPQQVYDVIKPARTQAAVRGGAGVTPSGLGKRVVAELCTELNIPVEKGVAVLKAAGFALATGDATLKNLAESTGRRPMEVYELLRIVAGKSPALANHGSSHTQ